MYLLEVLALEAWLLGHPKVILAAQVDHADSATYVLSLLQKCCAAGDEDSAGVLCCSGTMLGLTMHWSPHLNDLIVLASFCQQGSMQSCLHGDKQI